jgi:hypothetical protein
MKEKSSYKPIGLTCCPICLPVQLQNLYEAIYDEPIDKRNFRKKIFRNGFYRSDDKIDKSVPDEVLRCINSIEGLPQRIRNLNLNNVFKK